MEGFACCEGGIANYTGHPGGKILFGRLTGDSPIWATVYFIQDDVFHNLCPDFIVVLTVSAEIKHEVQEPLIFGAPHVHQTCLLKGHFHCDSGPIEWEMQCRHTEGTTKPQLCQHGGLVFNFQNQSIVKEKD